LLCMGTLALAPRSPYSGQLGAGHPENSFGAKAPGWERRSLPKGEALAVRVFVFPARRDQGTACLELPLVPKSDLVRRKVIHRRLRRESPKALLAADE